MIKITDLNHDCLLLIHRYLNNRSWFRFRASCRQLYQIYNYPDLMRRVNEQKLVLSNNYQSKLAIKMKEQIKDRFEIECGGDVDDVVEEFIRITNQAVQDSLIPMVQEKQNNNINQRRLKLKLKKQQKIIQRMKNLLAEVECS